MKYAPAARAGVRAWAMGIPLSVRLSRVPAYVPRLS